VKIAVESEYVKQSTNSMCYKQGGQPTMTYTTVSLLRSQPCVDMYNMFNESP